MFQSRNPGLHYHHGVVQQLKMVYDELLRPELVHEEVSPDPCNSKAVEKGGKKEKVGCLIAQPFSYPSWLTPHLPSLMIRRRREVRRPPEVRGRKGSHRQ